MTPNEIAQWMARMEKTQKEAQAMLLAAAPMACDSLCELVGDGKVRRSERLKSVSKLLSFAEAGLWCPKSDGARQAMPKIATILISIAGEEKTKYKDRLRAVAYLLQGINMKLWEVPNKELSQITLTPR